MVQKEREVFTYNNSAKKISIKIKACSKENRKWLMSTRKDTKHHESLRKSEENPNQSHRELPPHTH